MYWKIWFFLKKKVFQWLNNHLRWIHFHAVEDASINQYGCGSKSSYRKHVPEMQPKTEDPMACVNCRKEMASNESRWVDCQMTSLREDVVENSDPNWQPRTIVWKGDSLLRKLVRSRTIVLFCQGGVACFEIPTVFVFLNKKYSHFFLKLLLTSQMPGPRTRKVVKIVLL